MLTIQQLQDILNAAPNSKEGRFAAQELRMREKVRTRLHAVAARGQSYYHEAGNSDGYVGRAHDRRGVPLQFAQRNRRIINERLRTYTNRMFGEAGTVNSTLYGALWACRHRLPSNLPPFEAQARLRSAAIAWRTHSVLADCVACTSLPSGRSGDEFSVLTPVYAPRDANDTAQDAVYAHARVSFKKEGKRFRTLIQKHFANVANRLGMTERALRCIDSQTDVDADEVRTTVEEEITGLWDALLDTNMHGRTILAKMARKEVFPFGSVGMGRWANVSLVASTPSRAMYSWATDLYLSDIRDEANVRICEDCGDVGYYDDFHYTYDDSLLCVECIDAHYSFSECMDTYIRSDDAFDVYLRGHIPQEHDRDDICTIEYGQRHFAEREYNDVVVFLGDETSRTNFDREQGWEDSEYDDDDDDDDDYSPYIGNYHSSRDKLRGIPDKRAIGTPTVGFELEFELSSSAERSRSHIAADMLSEIEIIKHNGNPYRYMALERDGSLNCGFEMVTNWTSLAVHEQAMTKLLKESCATDGLVSHDTKTCGLHVHVDRRDMSLVHQLKLAMFINMPENQEALDAIARRQSNNYARRGTANLAAARKELRYLKAGEAANHDTIYAHPLTALFARFHASRHKNLRSFVKEYSDSLMSSVQDSRYVALNFNNHNTVEFRLFRGTKKFETIMATLEFAVAAYQYTAQAGWNDLTMGKFCEFVAKSTDVRSKYLKQYLVDRGVARRATMFIERAPKMPEALAA